MNGGLDISVTDLADRTQEQLSELADAVRTLDVPTA